MLAVNEVAQNEMFNNFRRVLTVNDEHDEMAKDAEWEAEIKRLLLMVDKFFYWNPYMDLRGEETLGECNWSNDVMTKLSCTPTGTQVTHSMRSYSVVQ